MPNAFRKGLPCGRPVRNTVPSPRPPPRSVSPSAAALRRPRPGRRRRPCVWRAPLGRLQEAPLPQGADEGRVEHRGRHQLARRGSSRDVTSHYITLYYITLQSTGSPKFVVRHTRRATRRISITASGRSAVFPHAASPHQSGRQSSRTTTNRNRLVGSSPKHDADGDIDDEIPLVPKRTLGSSGGGGGGGGGGETAKSIKCVETGKLFRSVEEAQVTNSAVLCGVFAHAGLLPRALFFPPPHALRALLVGRSRRWSRALFCSALFCFVLFRAPPPRLPRG